MEEKERRDGCTRCKACEKKRGIQKRNGKVKESFVSTSIPSLIFSGPSYLVQIVYLVYLMHLIHSIHLVHLGHSVHSIHLIDLVHLVHLIHLIDLVHLVHLVHPTHLTHLVHLIHLVHLVHLDFSIPLCLYHHSLPYFSIVFHICLSFYSIFLLYFLVGVCFFHLQRGANYDFSF